MPAGNSSEQSNAVGRHLLAKLHPLSRGHPQQIGDTPDDVVPEFIHSTVSVHNFPRHPNEPAATFVVQKLIELTGETVEIDSGRSNAADSSSSMAVAGPSRSKCDLRTA
jgi:hypothetical protein